MLYISCILVSLAAFSFADPLCDLKAAITSGEVANWTCTSAGASTNACSWSGIYCASGVVKGITVESKGLVGTIPKSLGTLTSLIRLDLSGNSFRGSIPPEIGSLTGLTTLDLSYNALEGTLPSTFGKFTAINYLNLYKNGLHGYVPSTYCNLTDTIIQLNVNGNPLNICPYELPTCLQPLKDQGRGIFSECRSHDKDKSCFSGSATIQMESGVTKLISEASVGDNVLSYSTKTNSLVYSEVIAVPHLKNDIKTNFITISTSSGNEISLTPSHFILAGICGQNLELKAASDLERGMCVQTVDGEKTIVSIEETMGEGIYTIVTNEEYVVVSGFVASPFSYSHFAANLYYNLYRVLHSYAPSVLKSESFLKMSGYISQTFTALTS